MITRIAALSSVVVLCALALTSSVASHAQTPKALLLFGGVDHKTFLGCLNCAATSSVSVCNDFGSYGSEFQSESIWNQFGEFGSKFRSQSPWNGFSDDAPIIVDKDGNSYGHFSANGNHHDRTRIGWLVAILDYFSKTGDLDKTRNLMCGGGDDDDDN